MLAHHASKLDLLAEKRKLIKGLAAGFRVFAAEQRLHLSERVSGLSGLFHMLKLDNLDSCHAGSTTVCYL